LDPVHTEGEPTLPLREDLSSAYTRVLRIADLDERAHALSDLGAKYHTLREEHRSMTDLEKAISALEEAVQVAPSVHPNLTKHSDLLGTYLQENFKEEKDTPALERVIQVHENVINLTDDLDLAKPARLSNLGTALQARFKHSEILADTENTISSYQKAVDLTPDGNLGKQLYLYSLGITLESRF